MKNLLKIIDKIEKEKPSNNIDLIFPSLVDQNKMKKIKSIIIPELSLIEKEIDYLLFSKIKNCKSINEANEYFDILQKMHKILAILFFKEKLEISDKLQKFIKDCDRLDDEWLRNKIFNKIKEDSYDYDFLQN